MPGIETRAPDRTETSSGFGGSPNIAVGRALDMRDAMRDLIGQAIRKGFAIGIIGSAHLSGDRKARRDGQTNRRHPIKVRAFAAKQVFGKPVAIGNAAAETVHILGHRAAGPFCLKRCAPLCSAAR